MNKSRYWRIIWAAAGVATALILSAGLFLAFRPAQITAKNAERIVVGMSLSEVETVLGPARDDSSCGKLQNSIDCYPPNFGLFMPLTTTRYWICDDLEIAVVFCRRSATVASVVQSKPQLRSASLCERLYTRLARSITTPKTEPISPPLDPVHFSITGQIVGGRARRLEGAIEIQR